MVSEGELLTSTWEHRLITGGSLLLMFALFGKGWSEVGTPMEAISGVAAILFAYSLSGEPLSQVVKFRGIWSTLSTGPSILDPYWTTVKYDSLQTLSSKAL